MAELRAVSTDKAPKAIGPYSQAIVSGDLIFCAGQVALDPATGELVSGDIRQQTARAIDNLAGVLEAAGSGLDRVVKCTVFLADFAEFAAMNEVYGQRFGQHRPARSTVGTSALPRGARVEIECIAVRR
ncbi:MAG TPA: RidA family protein [Candidatus Limnocylindria bacterium]|jgi:2-iminobutanoate/2-iminopropanoate deaminase|nr:RidA family protein [Candidatus Limnocylindria bacterium]